eukprot:8187301-Ditylum_brightwellii.AAC.2
MDGPIAFATKHYQDTMYFHQALKQPGATHYIDAIFKEITCHIEIVHWEAVWVMQHKREIKTRWVAKYKARLNVHCGQQQYGINCFDTYAPEVTWLSLPHDVQMTDELRRTYVLKLFKNVYRQKQANRVWYNHLKKWKSALLYYVDDSIFASPNQEDIDNAIMDIKNVVFDIEDKGNIEHYQGMIVYIQPNMKAKGASASATRFLTRDIDVPKFDGRSYYSQMIGELNYLKKESKEGLSIVTNQYAKFLRKPRESHEAAVEHIVCYLMAIKARGIILYPSRKEHISMYIVADFSRHWLKNMAMDNAIATKSRKYYIITYTDCTILWECKLQTL